MKYPNLIMAALLLAAPAALHAAETPKPAVKPNILFILVDDYGIQDVGIEGSTFYETPYIDALTQSGMRFTQGYANCPVCSPSRASILLGKYPPRHGITDLRRCRTAAARAGSGRAACACRTTSAPPGVTRPGSTCATPVIATDFYPTLLELAGLPLRPRQHVDGVSLVPFLKGGTIAPRPLFWHYPHYGNQGGLARRTGLVSRSEGSKVALPGC